MSKPDTNKLGVHNRYLVRKLEEESLRNWDLFYKRNTTNFFKVCDAVHEYMTPSLGRTIRLHVLV